MLVTLNLMVTKITRSRGIFLVAFLGIAVALAAALYTLQGSSKPSDQAEDSNSDQGAENVIGIWGDKDDGGPYLQFDEDGGVMGNDGCNGFSGQYTISDDGRRVVMHELLRSLNGCTDGDSWLREARSEFIVCDYHIHCY